MEYNFLDFTKEHYPEIWEEFYRYKRKDNLPAIGAEVITLRSGFGGTGGETRYVVKLDNDDGRYIGLGNMHNGKASYLCEIKTWWKDIKVIREPNID